MYFNGNSQSSIKENIFKWKCIILTMITIVKVTKCTQFKIKVQLERLKKWYLISILLINNLLICCLKKSYTFYGEDRIRSFYVNIEWKSLYVTPDSKFKSSLNSQSKTTYYLFWICDSIFRSSRIYRLQFYIIVTYKYIWNFWLFVM